MRDIQHLIRAGILALLVIIGFTVVRNFMVPESFGKYGHYRAYAIAEEMTNELVYQGSDVCKKCHENRYQEWSAGKHKVVNCEDCHSPANVHITKPMVKSGTKTIFTDHSNAICLRCHLNLPARPHDFDEAPHPQIDVTKHLKGKCIKCHNPHHPDLKQPEEKEVVEVENKILAPVEKEKTKPQLKEKVVESEIEIGRRIYEEKCLVCHGKTGDGKTPAAGMFNVKLADLSAPSYEATLSQIIDFTRDGKGIAMPAYRDELSKEEIQAVSKYIQKLKK